ncbi:MAG: hypothetical protein IJX99_02730 [Clostridia bacterium]|nr:hypothetical protein [Clostridia bacterium]
MNRKFLVLVLILLALIIFLNGITENEEMAKFNPLELEIGDTFAYLNSEEKRVVLNYEIGDVTGDGENDMIIVIGEKSGDELLCHNIDVVLYDIKNDKFMDTKLKKYSGSLPKIHLKDIDGDSVNDVIVIADLENVGQKIRGVSFVHDMPKEILNEKDSKGIDVSGTILDGFKASLKLKKLKKEAYIDLSENKGNYITSGFYMENGKLRTDKTAVTSAGISDIDFVQLDNQTGIRFVERIKGFDNLDIIEQIEVLMKYENGNWVIIEVKGERIGSL